VLRVEAGALLGADGAAACETAGVPAAGVPAAGVPAAGVPDFGSAAICAAGSASAWIRECLSRLARAPFPEVVVRDGAVGVAIGGGVPTAWVTGAGTTGAETGGVGAAIGGVGGAVTLVTTGAFASAFEAALLEPEEVPWRLLLAGAPYELWTTGTRVTRPRRTRVTRLMVVPCRTTDVRRTCWAGAPVADGAADCAGAAVGACSLGTVICGKRGCGMVS
jgi:hypothetical protein